MHLQKPSFLFSKGKLCISLSLLCIACVTEKDESTLPVKANVKNATQSLSPEERKFNSRTIDAILTTVGDEVILLSDLQQVVQQASHGETTLLATGELVGGSLTPAQAQGLLNGPMGLIDQRILSLKVKEMDLHLSEEALTKKIKEFLEQQNLTYSMLEEELKKTGTPLSAYREEFRAQMEKQLLISRAVMPYISAVTDDEVHRFYLQQTKSSEEKQVKNIKLRSLMLHIPNKGSEHYAEEQKKFLKKKADIEQHIKEGKDFESLVKEYSAAANAALGGELPPRPLDALPGALKGKIAHLNMHDIVGPIELGDLLFFFQYLGSSISMSSDLQKNFESWKNKLLDIKFEEKLKEYIAKEREKYKIYQNNFVIKRK